MAVGTEKLLRAGEERGGMGVDKKKKICDAVKRDCRPEHPTTLPHTPRRASRIQEKAPAASQGACVWAMEKVLVLQAAHTHPALNTSLIVHTGQSLAWAEKKSIEWGQNIYLSLSATRITGA